MGQKNVSLKTIALACGVSVNTVSHALRDMKDVSPATKALVRKKAIEFGYMPNHMATSIKADEKPVVGFLLNSFDNLYYNLFCKEMSGLVSENKEYALSILCSSSKEQVTEMDIKLCVLQRIDLLITHIPPSQAALELAKINHIEIIVIGGTHDDNEYDSIAIDNEMGCILAAKYLSNFHSHHRFIYVGINYFLSDMRFELFKNEMMTFQDCAVINFNMEERSIVDLYQYILEGYRSIFFYNDSTAYEVLNQLDKLVVDIRRLYPDLHLVGFDGLCKYIPGLRQISSLSVDFKDYAKQVYALIKNRLERPQSPYESVVLPVGLYQRLKAE